MQKMEPKAAGRTVRHCLPGKFMQLVRIKSIFWSHLSTLDDLWGLVYVTVTDSDHFAKAA